MATQHDQPERYGGDGLDFDRDRLTLRFESQALERAFQIDLGSRLALQHGRCRARKRRGQRRR